MISLCQTGLIIAHLRTEHFSDMLVVDLGGCRLAEVVKAVKVHGNRVMKDGSVNVDILKNAEHVGLIPCGKIGVCHTAIVVLGPLAQAAGFTARH